jgi:hypothetical protein
MPRWLPKVLVRIADLAAARKIALTLKAQRELTALELGLDPEDARDVLMNLTASDAAGRRTSDVTGEWMYIFKPRVAMDDGPLCQGDPAQQLCGCFVSHRRRS